VKIADAFVEVDLRSQKLERGFRRAEQTSRSSTSKIARHAKVMGDRVGRSFARASARVGGFVAAIASADRFWRSPAISTGLQSARA